MFAREETYGQRPLALGGTLGGSLQAFGYNPEDVEFPDKVLDVIKMPSFGAGRQYRRLQGGAISRPANLSFVPVNGLPLYYAWGTEVFTGGSPNIHALSTGTPASSSSPVRAILPSFSWAADMFDDALTRPFQRVFIGDVVDTATVTVSESSELMAKFALKAQDVQDEELAGPTIPASTLPGSPTASAGRPYMWFDSTVTVYGTEVCRITNFEASVNNKLQEKRYLCSGTGQNPVEYLTSLPEWSFTVDMVPAGHLATHLDSSSRRESVYDLLEGETYGDVSVELRRAGNANDSIRFDAVDCLFKEAPHSWKSDGNEMTVRCSIEPRNFTATVRDALAAYATI